MDSPLETILNPMSIAFFGASNNVMTMGSTQLLNTVASGFPGKVFPIHPKLDEVLGLRAYKSLEEVPGGERIDLAFIVLNAKHVPSILEDCGRRGIKHAVIITAGFRETGNLDKNKEVVDIAKRHGITFLGPNCIGFFNNHVKWAVEGEGEGRETTINTTWIPMVPRKGGVSIASQSGTYACHQFIVTEKIAMGISKTISVGNEAMIDLVDCLEYLEGDEQTKVIGLYIEEIKRGREFLEAAKRITATKPIVAIYVGGTAAGARGVMSHTGSLGGSDEVFDAACKQAGIIRVHGLQQLLDACHALDVAPLPKGNKLCIFTNAGGPGVNMADLAERLGLEVPVFSEKLQERLAGMLPPTAQVRNIVDFTFGIDVEKQYRTVPRHVLKSGEVDGMLVYGVFGSMIFDILKEMNPNIEIPDRKTMRELLGALLDYFCRLPGKYGTPIICVALAGRNDDLVMYLQDNKIPVYEMPERAVLAYHALVQYSSIKQRKDEQNPS